MKLLEHIHLLEKDINYRLVIQIRTLVRIKTKINQEKKNEIKQNKNKNGER
jgi:hypothetical protein